MDGAILRVVTGRESLLSHVCETNGDGRTRIEEKRSVEADTTSDAVLKANGQREGNRRAERLPLCISWSLLVRGQKTVEIGASHGLYNEVAMQNENEGLGRSTTSIEGACEASGQRVGNGDEKVYEAYVKRHDVERMAVRTTTTIQTIVEITTYSLGDYVEKRLIQEMHRARKGGISKKGQYGPN